MRERRDRSSRPRKDRLIQTRVPRDLEEALKEQADRRRLSVSHLIRNVLEDAFSLVDGVIDHVEVLVADSQDLGRQVRQDARDIARKAQEVGRRAADDTSQAADPDPTRIESADPTSLGPSRVEPGPSRVEVEVPRSRGNLDHILAWNQVTLNRAARCSSCDGAINRGESGHLGVSDTPGLPPAWLCEMCLAEL
jgi:hypothetical protein